MVKQTPKVISQSYTSDPRSQARAAKLPVLQPAQAVKLLVLGTEGHS